MTTTDVPMLCTEEERLFAGMGANRNKAKVFFSLRKFLQFHVLLLIAFAVLTIVTLLTSASFLGRPAGPVLPAGTSYLRPGHFRNSHMFSSSNETLLALVNSEPDFEHEKNLIKDLLEGSHDPSGTLRSSWIRRSWERRDRNRDIDERERLWSWDRRDAEERERRRPSGRHGGSESWPARLSEPHYAPFWPQFRALLSAWVANKYYDPKVMQNLVEAIKNPIDNHRHSKSKLLVSSPRKRYSTCAVVGNSGILLNNTYGSAIDAHEMVVRLNNARTSGFEKHVGSKTTIAFINSNILHQCARRVRCFCHPYGEDVPTVMYISQVHHFMDMAMCAPAHRAPLLVTDPRFDALATRIVKWYSVREFVEQTGKPLTDWAALHDGLHGFHYSSGLQAVMMALGICEEVHLFGFGTFNSSKHHYHTAQRKELSIHDYQAEYSFYDDLVAGRVSSVPFLSDAGIRVPSMRVFGQHLTSNNVDS